MARMNGFVLKSCFVAISANRGCRLCVVRTAAADVAAVFYGVVIQPNESNVKHTDSQYRLFS